MKNMKTIYNITPEYGKAAVKCSNLESLKKILSKMDRKNLIWNFDYIIRWFDKTEEEYNVVEYIINELNFRNNKTLFTVLAHTFNYDADQEKIKK